MSLETYSAPLPLLIAALQVAQLKEKIATEKGWEASSQKLIHSGKRHLWRLGDMDLSGHRENPGGRQHNRILQD